MLWDFLHLMTNRTKLNAGQSLMEHTSNHNKRIKFRHAFLVFFEIVLQVLSFVHVIQSPGTMCHFFGKHQQTTEFLSMRSRVTL